MHQLVDRLTPDQLEEIRAYALRLLSIGQRRTFVPWAELKRGAAKLPSVDHRRLRAGLDAVIDPDRWLGEER